jgi:hypothetical protein
MDLKPSKNATISINGGPEIPVRALKHDDGGRPSRRSDGLCPAAGEGIEMSTTHKLAPSGYEWLVRHALGEFNA